MKTKLTNRLGLPLPIVKALENDPYDSGDSDYTATSLLQPARARRLQQLFPDDCVEDVSERLYSLDGQATHVVLERAAKELSEEGYVVEKRFSCMVPVDGSLFKVSAQVDLFDPVNAVLQDYKKTSVAALSYGVKPEHKFQLNLQRYLVQRAGFAVEKLQIVGIFRDWSLRKAQASASYPQAPVVVQDVPLMTDEEVLGWVRARVNAHESAKKAKTQEQLAECTDEEVWTRTDDDVFAVEKDGAGRALPGGLFKHHHEAVAFKIRHKDAAELVIVERRGEAIKCGYCPARRVCVQWRDSARNPANQVRKQSKAGRSKVQLPPGFEDLE